jgi:hypothetical protein
MGNDGGESNLARLSLDSDKESFALLSFGPDTGYLAETCFIINFKSTVFIPVFTGYFLARERSFRLELRLARVHEARGAKKQRRFYSMRSAPATLLTTRNGRPTTTSLGSDKENLALLSFGSDAGCLAGAYFVINFKSAVFIPVFAMYFLARERSSRLELRLARVHEGTGPRKQEGFTAGSPPRPPCRRREMGVRLRQGKAHSTQKDGIPEGNIPPFQRHGL